MAPVAAAGRRLALLALLSVLAAACGTASACTLIVVGRRASADGSVMIAHTDDAGGATSDVRLVRIEAADHAPGSRRAVLRVRGGYPRIVAPNRGRAYDPKNYPGEEENTVLGYIDQVPHTYAYIDQDYGMINEKQLIIGETTTSARFAGWPKAPGVPFGNSLFCVEELSKIAMERCDSARCAIETMGALAVEHGFYSEESGEDPEHATLTFASETLAIGDKYAEAWMFSVLTGPNRTSAIWAARRVPDDEVAVAANSFTIRRMNLSDPANYLASPRIHEIAKETGAWHPERDGEFDFDKAFGYMGSIRNGVRALYVGRRIWRAMDLLAPSQRFDPYWGVHPDRPSYPFSVKPDAPVTREKIFSILRDHYEGTEFDLSRHLSAGPFHAPVRYDGEEHGVEGGWERPISIFRSTFSFVAVSRGQLPDPVGGVAWYGHDAPHGTVYVPFWVGVRDRDWPKEWAAGKQTEFSTKSAWWAFAFVNQWRMLRWDRMTEEDIGPLQRKLEAEVAEGYEKAEAEALGHCTADGCSRAATDALSKFVGKAAGRVLDAWWDLAWKLVAKYANGYVTTGEGEGQQESPGYSQEFLEATDFKGFPGKTYYLPGEEPAWGVHLPEGGRPKPAKPDPPAQHEPGARWSPDGRSFAFGVLAVVTLQAAVLGIVLLAKKLRGDREGSIKI
ncbi:putative peptidase [Hyaloraphidium curvatum]|nr:putative peptidase [Hyaloraphidium curvatum]